jgi:hypothetical protein
LHRKLKRLVSRPRRKLKKRDSLKRPALKPKREKRKLKLRWNRKNWRG